MLMLRAAGLVRIALLSPQILVGLPPYYGSLSEPCCRLSENSAVFCVRIWSHVVVAWIAVSTARTEHVRPPSSEL